MFRCVIKGILGQSGTEGEKGLKVCYQPAYFCKLSSNGINVSRVGRTGIRRSNRAIRQRRNTSEYLST